MTETPAAPRILRRRTSVRYLKAIAVFKMLQGLLLLVLGSSLLFLNTRTLWMNKMSAWTDDELLLHHSRAVLFLLEKLQDALAGGRLRATALLALFYAAVLFTEGIGVYLQKRWAELLMVFATGALIPLEARHLWQRPSVAAVAILLANCFIVWFLFRVLRRDAHAKTEPLRREAVEIR